MMELSGYILTILNFKRCSPAKKLLDKEMITINTLEHSDKGGDQPHKKADGARGLYRWWEPQRQVSEHRGN